MPRVRTAVEIGVCGAAIAYHENPHGPFANADTKLTRARIRKVCKFAESVHDYLYRRADSGFSKSVGCRDNQSNASNAGILRLAVYVKNNG